MPPSHKGLHELFTYPLMSAIFDRRTRRVARGTSVVSGPISYTSSNKPAPLSPLEEAVLVVSTGLTGKVTMHDVPAKNEDGSDRFSAPLINVLARSASSIDNAHAVWFFLINDEGTWLIRHFRNQDALALLSKLPPRWEDWSENDWISAAASVKHRLYKERLDFPRHWPYYFIWNRQLSNRPAGGHDHIRRLFQHYARPVPHHRQTSPGHQGVRGRHQGGRHVQRQQRVHRRRHLHGRHHRRRSPAGPRLQPSDHPLAGRAGDEQSGIQRRDFWRSKLRR